MNFKNIAIGLGVAATVLTGGSVGVQKYVESKQPKEVNLTELLDNCINNIDNKGLDDDAFQKTAQLIQIMNNENATTNAKTTNPIEKTTTVTSESKADLTETNALIETLTEILYEQEPNKFDQIMFKINDIVENIKSGAYKVAEESVNQLLIGVTMGMPAIALMLLFLYLERPFSKENAGYDDATIAKNEKFFDEICAKNGLGEPSDMRSCLHYFYRKSYNQDELKAKIREFVGSDNFVTVDTTSQCKKSEKP